MPASDENRNSASLKAPDHSRTGTGPTRTTGNPERP